MRVFVTGASGFVGSAVVQELLRAGHQVLGLARSDKAAAAIEAAGAAVHRGDLADPDSLARGAERCDGVVHTSFVHDFVDFLDACAKDRRAIETMGAVLAGKPFVVTSGVAMVRPAQGDLITEDDLSGTGHASPRAASDAAALALAGRGVRVSLLRLPPTVHGDGDHGFIPMLIDGARKAGTVALVGDGANRWPAVHRFDAAKLYRLALEGAPAGWRLHAVAEEGVAMRDVVAVLARRLGLPVETVTAEQAQQRLGFVGMFLGADVPTSSAKTRALLGWSPTHVDLLRDLEQGTYFG